MTTLAHDIKQARAERIPRMALRPCEGDDGALMDDVVVKDVSMFRLEMMDDATAWLCCYFPNGEQVTFWANARLEQAAPGKRRYPILDVHVTEHPPEWVDIDR